MGDVRDVVVTGWTKADGETLWMEHDGEPMLRAGRHPDNGPNRAIHLVPEALSARAAVPEDSKVAEVIAAARDVAKRAGPDRELRLHAALAALPDAAPQPAGEDDPPRAFPPMPETPFSAPNGMQLFDSMHMHMYALTCVDAWAGPAPSAPSPGDALSLHGAAGRSASRAPADVEALAMRMYGRWTDNQGIHCNRFPSWSELSEAGRDEWRKQAQQAAKDGDE